MKTLTKFTMALILTLVFSLSYSQQNYLPGYIIKKNKDTINGIIDFRDWDKTPNEIKFKSSNTNNPIVFNPLDIIEFGVEDQIYSGGIVETEVTKLSTNELKTYEQLNIKVDTTFLQVLIRGDKELFYYKNKDSRENYYIKRDGKFDLLVHKKYLQKQGTTGKSVIIENNRYLGQLTLYLKDCNTISSKLKNTTYTEGSLFRLFRHYNECTSLDIAFQKERKKLIIEVGALVGASLTSLKFSGSRFPKLTRVDYPQSVNFAGGIFLDLIFPKYQRKWSINSELFYSSYNVENQFKEVLSGENNFSTTTTEFAYSYIKINTLVRFKYPVGHMFIYVNAGFSNGFSISETNYMKEEFVFNSMVSIVEGRALPLTRNYEQGILFGTGLKYKRYSFEIRTEIGTGISKYIELDSTPTRFQFLLGYKF
ncbi:hypothetical protein [Psychroflexus sp. MES1-P1E]|uniref:hypothetical protein n=1 Tax=Psychroflexus sp. MES1-P1E TaxID=2058320 RepID=UPI000C7C6203|nr:hypothetical protein [Psychroflexus sp. MES1-P1E]PKG41270.1 hypothetical protein CXF67_16925 [Psychroflexus sp. MES1-P1E]